MNILILGNGAREHALAWKISESSDCSQVYVAPGNGGTAKEFINIDILIDDFEGIKKTILEKKIDLLVIGSEAPLVQGLVDFLKRDKHLNGVKVIGPSQEGAMLEASKEFAKHFMERYHIPTAKSFTVTKKNLEEGLNHLKQIPPPYVLKADGLAAGKGVIITSDLMHAESTLTELILKRKFGEASEKVLIEQYLEGIEVSFFALTDGEGFVVLPEAKDYKRIGENDVGLNTGGMGAVSPVVFVDDIFRKKVIDKVIRPTIEGIKKEGFDYCGFLFFGLINVKGDPWVIEYNVRMGDPETQAVLPRIKTDFLSLLIATADKQLKNKDIEIEPCHAVTVVYANCGYPEVYQKGGIIQIEPKENSGHIFHAGTTIKDNNLVASGGRVISSTGLSTSLHRARNNAYQLGENIVWKDKIFRSDIGYDLQNYKKEQ